MSFLVRRVLVFNFPKTSTFSAVSISPQVGHLGTGLALGVGKSSHLIWSGDKCSGEEGINYSP